MVEPFHEDEHEAPSLQQQRMDVVVGLLVRAGVRSVLDLGCGAGDLLARLADRPALERLVGLDLSPFAVDWVCHRLGHDPRVEAREGSFTDPSLDLTGFDAATLVETIEHVERDTLPAVVATVLGTWRPGLVVVTTPNREYNVRYGLRDGQLRHPDHRFEWDRRRFRAWATDAARRHDYGVRFEDIGDPDDQLGSPTQAAVLRRRSTASD